MSIVILGSCDDVDIELEATESIEETKTETGESTKKVFPLLPIRVRKTITPPAITLTGQVYPDPFLVELTAVLDPVSMTKTVIPNEIIFKETVEGETITVARSIEPDSITFTEIIEPEAVTITKTAKPEADVN